MARHVFIIGSRGLPAHYGGFETFVEALLRHQHRNDIRYHVACQRGNSPEHAGQDHFEYLGADCFNVDVPNIGPARVIAYDGRAIKAALRLVKSENMERPIFYVLGNTIGGLMRHFARSIHAMGGLLFVNPDGLEWRRTKWSAPVRAYLKFAERGMARQADLIVADNAGIADYLAAAYGSIRSKVIAYGTEQLSSQLTASPVLDAHGARDYYLVVGRFVPENNYEAVIRAFMASQTTRDLVLVTDFEGKPYYEELRRRTGFDKDPRVKFVGTVYDQEELRYIREHAYAYIHGHEVGGTNPGLLEALWSTSVNLVLDVVFNRETAGDVALYFKKSNLIEQLAAIEQLSDAEREDLRTRARARVKEKYSWDGIAAQYEALFIES